ncbi:MAG: hypothetical protein KBD23_02665 [Gammaproteobacteria bacterium]|nr:hypothetical protein [Gammaproteobacteria bacterium]MBP9729027.1 hypothetical protein [Gammaproteobacteria bacterium]
MRALSLPAYGGYVLLALILWVAWDATALCLDLLAVGAFSSVVLGLGAVLATAYYYPSALAHSKSTHLQVLSPLKDYGTWLLSCAALCVLSFYFFYFLEQNTQLNPRLYGLASGTMLGVFKQHALSVGLWPWLLYIVLGLGLAYATVIFKKRPLLSELCLLSIKNTRTKALLHSLLSIPLDLVKIAWCVVTASFMALWIASLLAGLFHWEPLFVRPLRLIFMGGLIVFVLRKPSLQLVLWMEKSKVSIATIFLIYLGIFVCCLLWLHATADAVSLGSETNQPDVIIKSVIAGSLTAESLKTHVCILIVGWWSLWLPWMASQAAKTALGGSMLGALLKLSLPVLLIFGINLRMISVEQSTAFPVFLDQPWVQGLAWCLLCLWLRSIWGGIYNMGDLQRGAMIALRPLSQRSLNRWMTVFFAWLSCYLLGYFMLGWRFTQWIAGAAACVMIALALVFSVAWVSSLMPSRVLKKCRFLGLS